MNGVVQEQGPPPLSVSWSDIAGVSEVSFPGNESSASSTTTFQFDCTTPISATVVVDGVSTRNFVFTTSLSGDGVVVVTALTSSNNPPREFTFDGSGNLINGGLDGMIEYEPTDQQVVNIVLFEEALSPLGVF